MVTTQDFGSWNLGSNPSASTINPKGEFSLTLQHTRGVLLRIDSSTG